MFPLRDHNPSERTPYVVLALIAINAAVFLYQLPLFETRGILFFYDAWALVPAELSAGEDLHTLVTYQFLHGGWMHILGNMLFLWVFGDNLEDEMGHLGFLAFYLGTGIAAAGAEWLAGPGSPVPMVGASGAVAGVMGGYLLLYPKARVDTLVFWVLVPIKAWIVLGIWFALQIGNGVLSLAGPAEVAYWAHAGGFLAGIAATVPIWLARGGPAFWDRTDGHPPHAETRVGRSNVPVVRR